MSSITPLPLSIIVKDQSIEAKEEGRERGETSALQPGDESLGENEDRFKRGTHLVELDSVQRKQVFDDVKLPFVGSKSQEGLW